MQSTIEVLARVQPFRALSDEAVRVLASMAEEAEVRAGQVVYDEASLDPHLYVVGAGTVRLERTTDESNGWVRTLGPYSIFGWRPASGSLPDGERVSVEKAGSLVRIDSKNLREVLAREPKGGQGVIEALVDASRAADPAPPIATKPGRLWATLARGSEWARRPQTYWALLGYFLFFGSWYLAVEVLALPRFSKLPGITQVVREWLSRDPVFGTSIYTPAYYEHIGTSLRRIGLAFFLATGLGVPTGWLLGASTRFREYVFPVFELLRPIPILAWVPLAIIVFSGSETPVVFLTFLASFFATALNTLLGVQSVDRQFVLAARCLGASRLQTFRHVIIPGSLPFVFTGLQISIGVAWFSLAAAEMVSGQFGLGYLINTSYTMVQYPTIVIGMLTLGGVGYGTSALVRRVGRRLMTWHVRALDPERS